MPQKTLKIITLLLIAYALIAGMLLPVPALPILNETARNLYYHVPMWFGMLYILGVSFWQSIKYLQTFNNKHNIKAQAAAQIGTLYGVLGLITGMLWANYTWGQAWSNDPKQLVSAIGLLIYFAYFILRSSIEDPEKQAKISAVYNIFAFCMLIPLLFVVPRLTDSLHPGNGGNPGFNSYDLDNQMRLVFYPAVIGFCMLAWWCYNLCHRTISLQHKKLFDEL